MGDWLLWYLVISGLGWLAFPILYRLAPSLADRGYTVSRALGWLLWGFLFWLPASLGLLRNEVASLLLAAAFLGVLSLWALSAIPPHELTAWFRARARLVVIAELLFLASFGLWTLVRATNPEALGTEKPMELAFINAILRSPAFPPHDPWLSGYAISYYYFGYVLVAMLAMICGTEGAIAFNLGGSLLFSLSALGAYGLVYNLLRGRNTADEQRLASSGSSHLWPLFGPLFLLLVSNLEGFLQVLHGRGLFWRVEGNGVWASPFWKWLDIKDLNQPPTLPLTWMPRRFWWWWRASRVLQDYDLAGVAREIIDEFPFFAYLLADLHPHVLAMPFGLLAMHLALALFWGDGNQHRVGLRLSFLRGEGEPSLALNLPFFLLGAVCLGGMAFLNTWDFPTFVALAAGSFALGRLLRGERTFWQAGGDLLKFGMVTGFAGVLLYLPFYLGFSSQVGGILPNLIYPTRGAHFWVMFAPLLLPIFAYLLSLRRLAGEAGWLRRGLVLSGSLMLALFALSLALGGLILLIPPARTPFLGSLNAQNGLQVITAAFTRRLSAPGGWLTLLGLLSLTLGWLIAWTRQTNFRIGAHAFAVLLILMGGLLTLGPEFFYLRDLFGWRMNTIFKFYFLAWQMWSLAAAYGSVHLLQTLRQPWRAAFSGGLILLLAASLVYPTLSLWEKTNGFNPPQWTLDSSAYLRGQSPDEGAAIAFLQRAPLGVVAEAVDYQGGDYREYGRMATFSGQPTVLGWIGHQNQWRGAASGEAIGTRQADIERLYCTRNWQEARAILQRYAIRYVVVGNLERSTYLAGRETCPNGLVENKFIRNLAAVFRSPTVVIYEFSGYSSP